MIRSRSYRPVSPRSPTPEGRPLRWLVTDGQSRPELTKKQSICRDTVRLFRRSCSPAPDIVRDLCEQVPYYAERHLVKPGITGWAQINFRYGASVQDAKRKLQFDLYYLKHMSFELDMAIILRTVGTFLRGGC